MKRGDEEGKPFADKIVVARELAAQLSEPAKQMLDLGESYASRLVAVDPGVRALIRAAIEGEKTPEEVAAVCDFFKTVRQLVAASVETATSLQGLAGTLAANARMSRDLRPVLREIRTGLQGVLDGQSVIQDWERQIDAAGIDCDDEADTS